VQSAEGVLEALVDEQPDRSRRQFILSLAHLLAASLQSQRLNAIAMHAAAGREAERLRSAMVSSVSHELKTPLASITAAVTDLLEPDIQRNADAVQQKLRDVNEDLHRLDDAIADLLDVSRLEAQAWEPRPTDFEVGELVGSVVSRMPRTARERIRYAIPEDLPMLHLDFVQLSRALHHVLGNALEYSEGPVTVGAEADGQFVIWVGDEGPGIPDAEKPLVFDKFYRGAAGRSQRSSTGLGLSITREIVRANGGEVAIRDARPHGTKLLLSLPLEGRP
jgi:two-component system sensor histidine kinase KdpD